MSVGRDRNIVDLVGVHLTLETRAGPVSILRGIDLRVDRGETVSIVGPSGSGKTTMMLVMSGLERPTGGVVTLAKHDLGALDEDALAQIRREHVGILFQDFHLIPTMTALENVAVPLELVRQADALERARAALSSVGLEARLDHYPVQLSGGEQQRVALARGFVGEPALLLADEPTGNLDRATGARIIDLLFSLVGRNATTLVVITHDDAIAERCARRVEIADGRICGDARAADGDHAAAASNPAPSSSRRNAAHLGGAGS